MSPLSTPAYAQLMARYNSWQNKSLVASADRIGETARRAERGAFFGSIQKTFSHLLWGDQIWLSRLGDAPAPQAQSIAASVAMVEDWDDFRRARAACDAAIETWADALDEEAMSGALSWRSASLGRDVGRPRDLLILHLFNHQTHHRGQLHAMLTAAGARPEPTDLFAMPGLED